MRDEVDFQTEVTLDGVTVVLARWQDRDHLRTLVEEAAATTGRFVDVDTADGHYLSWFITSSSRMTMNTFRPSREFAIGETVMLSDGGTWDLF